MEVVGFDSQSPPPRGSSSAMDSWKLAAIKRAPPALPNTVGWADWFSGSRKTMGKKNDLARRDSCPPSNCIHCPTTCDLAQNAIPRISVQQHQPIWYRGHALIPADVKYRSKPSLSPLYVTRTHPDHQTGFASRGIRGLLPQQGWSNKQPRWRIAHSGSVTSHCNPDLREHSPMPRLTVANPMSAIATRAYHSLNYQISCIPDRPVTSSGVNL
ncbi:hypothetical protein BO86DRAFT_34828 [Aspergillus japonicus CBS 114.51]|uniref:Uncharacterized protein n=1 Tax=Aspergillus japonicus CBS 114.51 TaxID=1448312 RepID=A0A8T8X852_ASPJA|nr:hypothetical protein BO86DRAFT_34828 [Aspergillus japonicus CBS 114.51]RAH83792.1 hypothetical protein BO86DRAFT_34828 [Aspergillus japonicus CBS 114.51]